jgi:hypothetical protein
MEWGWTKFEIGVIKLELKWKTIKLKLEWVGLKS